MFDPKTFFARIWKTKDPSDQEPSSSAFSNPRATRETVEYPKDVDGLNDAIEAARRKLIVIDTLRLRSITERDRIFEEMGKLQDEIREQAKIAATPGLDDSQLLECRSEVLKISTEIDELDRLYKAEVTRITSRDVRIGQTEDIKRELEGLLKCAVAEAEKEKIALRKQKK